LRSQLIEQPKTNRQAFCAKSYLGVLVTQSRSRLLILILAVVSFSVWLLVIASGEKDPTDSGIWYLGLLVPTIIAGILAPVRPWRWAAAIIAPQFVAPFYPEVSNLWPLSFIFLGVLFGALVLAAQAGAWLRRTAGALFKSI
jgi:hypothetical protein